ncbi:hypothetical protein QR680_003876 [Steinernema hermaphroditum]|uniref:Uncharacterized protein n=1 Tax=Steinernema hermaphroditum TaxID=289476 RepID=A0AA39HP47_9BILA|nr:hypothetical protein QR680_003876 [Steinernema hermaphroditum]
MDFLPHALVDHIVDFLPLSDVKTIIKATVLFQEQGDCDGYDDDDDDEYQYEYEYENKYDEMDGALPKRPRLENERKNAILVQMYIEKRLFGGTRPIAEWDFKNWRHARLGKVKFYACWPRADDSAIPTAYPQVDSEEVVRVISLPVASKDEARQPSSLSFSYLCPYQLDSALNMANSVQKTFSALEWNTCWNGSGGKVGDFLYSYLDGEVFLEELRIYIKDVWELEDGPERIIALFKRKNSFKLDVNLDTISPSERDGIITHWKESSGVYRGYKEICLGEYSTASCEMSAHGYFVHRSKRSSLHITDSELYLMIVKFEPWHEPVSLEWIDSKWRKGEGLYVHRGKRKMKLLMNDEEWRKFIEKYGTVEELKNGPSIDHPSNFATLEISRGPETLVICEAKVGN